MNVCALERCNQKSTLKMLDGLVCTEALFGLKYHIPRETWTKYKNAINRHYCSLIYDENMYSMHTTKAHMNRDFPVFHIIRSPPGLIRCFFISVFMFSFYFCVLYYFIIIICTKMNWRRKAICLI